MLGKYRLDSVIGEGGMGVVLKARHLDLDEDVAIKCLLPAMLDRAEVVARFLREAKATAKLKGEHICHVFDVGRLPDSDVPYMVMEYLRGSDLNRIVKQYGRQEPAVAVDLMMQACEAIAEAHSLGIIHRDLKGSNFFITQADGEPPALKVLDFGIATAPDGDSELTNASSVLGTPAYMAPEQTAASRSVDARSDIWSLGIVLYELLEGKRPFAADAYYDLCLLIRTEPPPPLTGELPVGLEAVVLKCLEKAREQRFQNVAELALALVPFASNPMVAGATAEQCARLARRSGPMKAPDPSGKPARLTGSIPIPAVLLDSQPAREKTPASDVSNPKTPPPSSRPKTPPPLDASNPKTPPPSSRQETPPPLDASNPKTPPPSSRPKTPPPLDASNPKTPPPGRHPASDVRASVDHEPTPPPGPSTPASVNSINASNGEMSVPIPEGSFGRGRRSIGIAVVTIAVVIGAGIYLSGRTGDSDAPRTPAAVPDEADRVEPATPPVVPPAPTKVEAPPVPVPVAQPPAPKPPPDPPKRELKRRPPPKKAVPPPKAEPRCQPPDKIDPFDDTPVCKR